MEVRKYFRWVWVKGEIAPGLVVSVLALAYTAVGYSGWLGETWKKENHDKVALFSLVMGLGLLGFGYLEQRAERIGSQRARRQFAAAAVVLGIVGFVLTVGASVFAAVLVAVALIMFGGPWLSSAGLDDWRALLFKEPGILTLAVILLGAVIVAGAVECLLRRSSLKKGRVAQEEAPYVGPWPALTFSIASSAFFLSFGGISLVFGLGVLSEVANRNALLFPQPIGSAVAWLDENRSMSWALPVGLVMLLAIGALHLYRRARSGKGIGATPKISEAVLAVSMACLGFNLMALVAVIASGFLGAR